MENKNIVPIIIGIVVLGVVGYFVLSGGSKDAMDVPEPAAEPVQRVDQVQPAMEEEDEAMEEMGTIVDIAVANDDFSTLVTAVQEADLVEVLSSEGPFTVFAPTDAAFAKVPAETLNSLLADKEALTDVLTYHVVPGKVMSADVVNLTSATTVQGQDVTIAVAEDGAVTVDGAEVIAVDIEASNGVIHVIDAVILPQ